MDRRLHRRRAIALNFRVHDAESGELLGRIGDVSPGGMLLYGENALLIGTVHRLRIDYPDDDDEVRSAVFEAQSQWTGRDAQPGIRITGLRLLNLDQPATAQALASLLDRYTVGDDPDDDAEG